MDEKRDASLLNENSDLPNESRSVDLERLPLNREAILSHLTTRIIGSRLLLFDKIDSTNSLLLGLSESEAVEGTVAVAEHQTAGRGRHGRNWLAPPGTNLLFSVLLSSPGRPLGLVTLTGAVSVVQALRERGVSAAIKWPNDVVWEGRKLAGVLCETRSLSDGDSAPVLGIGLNVNMRFVDYPEEVRETARSAMELLGSPLDRNALLASILNRIEEHWEKIGRDEVEPFMETARRFCETLGHVVKVTHCETVLEGTAEDLDDSGRLVLALENGVRRIIEMGEVHPSRRVV